jgi:hypothetical protein
VNSGLCGGAGLIFLLKYVNMFIYYGDGSVPCGEACGIAVQNNAYSAVESPASGPLKTTYCNSSRDWSEPFAFEQAAGSRNAGWSCSPRLRFEDAGRSATSSGSVTAAAAGGTGICLGSERRRWPASLLIAEIEGPAFRTMSASCSGETLRRRRITLTCTWSCMSRLLRKVPCFLRLFIGKFLVQEMQITVRRALRRLTVTGDCPAPREDSVSARRTCRKEGCSSRASRI